MRKAFCSAFVVGTVIGGLGQAGLEGSPRTDGEVRRSHLADWTPMNLPQLNVLVTGDFGGQTYYPTGIPQWRRLTDGSLIETDESLAVGSTVKVLAFVRFKGSYYYRLESKGKPTESRFVDGRFLTVAAP
jgi:hypothetical protein